MCALFVYVLTMHVLLYNKQDVVFLVKLYAISLKYVEKIVVVQAKVIKKVNIATYIGNCLYACTST